MTIEVNGTILNPYFVNVSITREIDGLCSFAFSYPLSDNPKVQSLVDLARVDIKIDNNIIFSGRISNIQNTIENSTLLRTVSGKGLIEDLRHIDIPPNILHHNENLNDIFDPSFANTVILDPSWSTTVESGGYVTAYLTSLQSSVNAISTLCQLTGFHFRYTNDKNIEFFKSLVDSGITIQNESDQGCFEVGNTKLLIDGEVTQSTDSTEVYNYVYAVGGTSDNGINQLTLRDVRPTTIDPNYPISTSSFLPNTDAVYNSLVFTQVESAPNTYVAFVVSSPVSIANYGKRDKTVARKDIHTLSSDQNTFSNADRQDAADQLYLAIVEELKLHEAPKVTYTCKAQGGFIDLKVGQTIKLKTRKEIDETGCQAGSGVAFDIDVELIVTRYTINFKQNNVFEYQFEFSNIPKVNKGDIEILTDTIETVNDYERQRKGSVTTYPQHFKDSFDSDHPLTGFLYIPKGFVYSDYLELKVKISPFRSYAKGATSEVVTSTVPSTVTTATSAATTTATTTSTQVATTSTQVATTSTTSTTTATQVVTTASQAVVGSSTTSSTAASHTHTVTDPVHDHDIVIQLGNYTFGTPVYYSPTSPPLGTLGGGLILGQYTSGAGGGTTVTSVSSGSHSHSVPGQNITIPPLNATIPPLSVTIPPLNVTIPGQNITIPGQSLSVPIPALSITVTIPSQTITIPASPITLEYGIFEDTTIPTGFSLWIDGVDYSSQVVIPDGFGVSPTGNTQFFDIALAAANLGEFNTLFSYGIHLIELRCASGRANGELHFYQQSYLSSK